MVFSLNQYYYVLQNETDFIETRIVILIGLLIVNVKTNARAWKLKFSRGYDLIRTRSKLHARFRSATLWKRETLSRDARATKRDGFIS